MKILVGADPEVFVKQNGIFKSAHGLIKGDKQHPFPVNKGAVQIDGLALEFNIDPAATDNEFLVNIQSVYKTLRDMVPDYEVVATPVADFTEEYMKSLPAESLILGCDPDFNAWTNGGENVKPNGNLPMRTAAGHVHIGWCEGADKNSPGHIADCCAVVKQLDYYLGLVSLLFDGNTRRRSMYGAAGCFRPKSYGVEYRVLSNAWLNSEKLIKWVFNNTQIAMDDMVNGYLLADEYGNIQQIINTSNVKEAKAIINNFNIPVPQGV